MSFNGELLMLCDRLEVLYLGGNQLVSIPDEFGYLRSLSMLVLCDNVIESLPRSLINLRRLESLSLHNNRLSTLPPEITRLNLVELSLRNNPLVVRSVRQSLIGGQPTEAEPHTRYS